MFRFFPCLRPSKSSDPAIVNPVFYPNPNTQAHPALQSAPIPQARPAHQTTYRAPKALSLSSASRLHPPLPNTHLSNKIRNETNFKKDREFTDEARMANPASLFSKISNDDAAKSSDSKTPSA